MPKRRYRLNVKLLLGLIVGGMILVVGVHFLHGYQLRRTAGNLLKAAAAAEEKGDAVEACTLLRRYLNLRHYDYPVYVKLADAVVELPDVPNITREEKSAGYASLQAILLQVPPEQPEYEQLVGRMVDFAMNPKIRDYNVALNNLRILVGSHPDDVTRNMQYAQALWSVHLSADAESVFSQLIGLVRPDRKSATKAAATLRFQLEAKNVNFDDVVGPLDGVSDEQKKVVEEYARALVAGNDDQKIKIAQRFLEAQKAGGAPPPETVPLLRYMAQARWAKGIHQVNAYVHLAAIVQQQTDRAGARKQIEPILNQMVMMNKDSFKAYLGRADYRLQAHLDPRDGRDLKGATEDLAQARKLAPDDVNVILQSKQLAMTQANDLTRKAMDEGRDLDEEEQDRIDKFRETARQYLEAGLKKHPKETRLYVALAQVESQGGDYKAALAVLQDGLDRLPGKVDLLGKVNLLLAKAESQFSLRDFGALDKTAAQLKQLDLSALGQAYVERRIAIFKASRLLVENKVIEAAKILEALRPQAVDTPDLAQRIDLQLGQCYQRMGQVDRAKDAYDRAVRADQLSAVGNNARILSERLARRAASAAASQTTVASGGNGQGGQQQKADLQQQLATRLENLRTQNKNVTKVQEQATTAAFWLQNKEFTKAGAAFAKLRQLATTMPAGEERTKVEARAWNGSIQVAILDPDQGLDQALKLCRQAREKLGDTKFFQTTDERVRISYIHHLLDQLERVPQPKPEVASKVLDEARKLLDASEKTYGDTALVRAARIRFVGRQGGDDVAQRLRRLEEGIDARTKEEQPALWSQVWRAYYRNGLRKDARRALGKLAEFQPNNLRLKTTLFDLALESGDEAGMQKAIADLKSSGDNTEWKCCEAIRLASLVARSLGAKRKLTAEGQSQLDQAQKLIDEVTRSRPKWSKPYRVQGDIQLLEKRPGAPAAAIASYRKALEYRPPDPMAARKLYALLSRQGRSAEAEQIRQQFGAQLGTGVAPEQQAENLIRTGKTDQALKLAQEMVDQNPNSARLHFWHGQMLSRAKQILDARAKNGPTQPGPGAAPRGNAASAVKKLATQAEGAFRRAVELAPQWSTAWLALITTLAADGKQSAAEAQLRKAQLNLAEDELLVLQAQCETVLGKPAAAEKYYRMAVAAAPDNLGLWRQLATFYLGKSYQQRDKLGKASHALSEILDRGKKAAGSAGDVTPNVAWARVTMARLLAASRQYANVKRGIALIEQNKVGNQLAPQYVLEIVRLEATRSEPDLILDAIQRLAQLNATGQLPLEQQLLLAQLYHRAGQDDSCTKLLRGLLAKHASNAQVVALDCAIQIDEKNLTRAARRLDRLETLAVTNRDKSIARKLKMRLLAERGKTKEAVAMLNAGLPKTPTAKDLPVLVAAARMLVQFKQYDEAEKLYRKIAELEPRTKLQLADFLAQHGNLDEAFKILDATRGTRAELAGLQIATRAINGRRDELGDRYDARIQAWFDRLAGQSAGGGNVLMSRAQFRDGQGRPDEAEKIYRKLLARTDLPPSVRARVRNNLAYLLAMSGKQLDEGRKMIDQAIEVLGPQAELFDTRAMVELAQGGPQNLERARADIERSLVSGRSAMTLFHLALVEAAAGDDRAARQALKEAQSLGLDKSQTHGLERGKYEQLLRKLGVAEARRERTAA